MTMNKISAIFIPDDEKIFDALPHHSIRRALSDNFRNIREVLSEIPTGGIREDLEQQLVEFYDYFKQSSVRLSIFQRRANWLATYSAVILHKVLEARGAFVLEDEAAYATIYSEFVDAAKVLETAVAKFISENTAASTDVTQVIMARQAEITQFISTLRTNSPTRLYQTILPDVEYLNYRIPALIHSDGAEVERLLTGLLKKLIYYRIAK